MGSSVIVILPLILLVGGIAVMVFIFSLRAGLVHEHVTSQADGAGDDVRIAPGQTPSGEALGANDDDSMTKVA